MDIKLQILEKAENDYKEFFSSLIPNINNVLGVRLPVLRKIAKEIHKSGKWENFIKQTDCQYMEEIMLQGMVIGLVKKSPEEILELVKDFVPKINNWAVCDTFCVGLKFTNNNKELVWNFIQPYFTSKEEYDIRFGYVMLLSYFIDNDYIDRVLDLIDNFRDERYYSRMAVAWALSICYVKQPEKTLEYLKTSKLDNWTFNKSIQKICESLRVDKSTKNMLKCLKRK
ncbi:MAG TPA: DNA alkylation repair protein [Candidatus Stercorousia faecigallinarum]|nr:DNA alkylation repair protein [Candidatus Stercorousia faecigallinarum]